MAKRGANRSQSSFSLRRIFLQRARISENQRNNRLNDVERGVSSNDICEEVKGEDRRSTDSTNNRSDIQSSNSSLQSEDSTYCIICCLKESSTNPFHTLDLCLHRFCCACLIKYLKNEISESRTDIACPQCSSTFHPNNIEFLLKNLPDIKSKYEDFMIRRYLVSDPDSRWCPAPDCSYAVIASGCASCPQLQCERPDCGVSFCYHCKAEWHPDQACDAARTSRQNGLRTSSISFILDSSRRDDIKPCPRCQVLIVKMNDGSCNHMVCSVCGAEFCWLCMKEVSDLHYLSPSGCTFWGKKPWSRKKKIVWQIGTLIGAPVGIALLAGIAVPSMVIGIPVWVGRKLLDRYKTKTKQKRNITVTLGVTASILISPFLAGLAIAIGVPILLFYVYGIVPVSLCRAGCATTTNEDYKFDVNINDENRTQFKVERDSIDAVSRIGETSIGDVSLSAASGSINDSGGGDNNLAQKNQLPYDKKQKSESSEDVTFANKCNRSSIYANDTTSATSAIVLTGSLTSCKQ